MVNSQPSDGCVVEHDLALVPKSNLGQDALRDLT